MRDYRDAGGTVRQSAGITAADVARIEATAHLPRPRGRGRGMEAPATAKARAELDVAIIRTMRDCLARVSEAAAFTWRQVERRPDGSATITFRRPKTDADTTAYLAPATVAALDAVRRRGTVLRAGSRAVMGSTATSPALPETVPGMDAQRAPAAPARYRADTGMAFVPAAFGTGMRGARLAGSARRYVADTPPAP